MAYDVIYRADRSNNDGKLLWEPGCPVTLEAVQISKNTETSESFLQIKVCNISSSIVSSICGFATVCYAEGPSDRIDFEEPNLDLPTGYPKALKAISLSSGDIVSATVTITQAVQTEGKWITADKAVAYPEPIPLELSDRASSERERLLAQSGVNGEELAFIFQDNVAWWLCSCGQLNVKSDVCCGCGVSKAILRSTNDERDLLASADEWSDSVYQKAASLASDKSNTASLLEAIELFGQITEWKDAAEQVSVCEAKIYKLEKASSNRRKLFIGVAVAAVIAAIVGFFVVKNVIIPRSTYDSALLMAESGDYYGAIATLESLENYGGAAEQIERIKGEKSLQIQAARQDISAYQNRLSAGGYQTIGLLQDGTVISAGSNSNGECDVADWTGITAVSAGRFHTVGLCYDGTVVATGANVNGQCDVSGWTDIVAISVGWEHTVGLRKDGTVVATAYIGSNAFGQCGVSDWEGIVAISAGGLHTVGLRTDGTVVAVGYNGNGQCDVSNWTDIIAISAGPYRTVGLRSDGTVITTGTETSGQGRVMPWTDIVAISAGDSHTVGLCSDGTVVAVGANDEKQCEVTDWTDIVSISAGIEHTVGLRSDGTVVAVGSNSLDQCEISVWQLGN